MGSELNRFAQLQQPQAPRHKQWGICWGGLSIFRKQKGGKRIVPTSRVSETNPLSNQSNGPQANGLPNPTNRISHALFAPPSSPASFSNSALPSTAPSPNCFLSANSPENPSTMFVTGPYAHELQLVSPPVFSTYTTEPSTAPLTPPPELAHLTTPSSPDVPYARFSKIKTSYNNSPNDLQATYSLYPGSLAIHPQDLVYLNSESGRSAGLRANGDAKARQDSNFFCPETFAQFYLDQSSNSNHGGRLSISRESDAYSNGNPNRQSKNCKPDAEELETYRASFGFSADEIISTTHYVEISDVMEESFSMTPCTSYKVVGEEHLVSAPEKGVEPEKIRGNFPTQLRKTSSFSGFEDEVPKKRFGDVSGHNLSLNHVMSDDDCTYSKMGPSRIGHKYNFGSSNSDAEIEYRRGRSLREGRNLRET